MPAIRSTPTTLASKPKTKSISKPTPYSRPQPPPSSSSSSSSSSPLDLSNPTRKSKSVTPFQESVYTLLKQIPEGRISSYAAIARALSSKTTTTTTATTKTAAATTTITTKTTKTKEDSSSSINKKEGTTKLSRAVGGACRNNPFAPEVPCHRCIGSSGYIGGFMGDWRKAPSGMNCEKKLALLKGEGVEFDGKGMLVDKKLWWDGFEV